jgi:hypothetical protein
MGLLDFFNKKKEVRIDETAKQAAKPDENLLFQTARNSQNDQERRTAIISLNNQSLLSEIVINAGDNNNIGLDSCVALRKVTDSDILKNIAKNAKNWCMRAPCCKWLEDVETLKEISKNDTKEIVRNAADARLRVLNDRKPTDSVPSFESLFFRIGLFSRGGVKGAESAMCEYCFESMRVCDQFVAYGKEAAQVMKSYLMACAAGREQSCWWQNARLIVECIPRAAGRSDADRLMLRAWLTQLVNAPNNSYEYEKEVRRFAKIELDALPD